MHCTCLVFLCSQCVSVNVHACLATQQRRLLNHNLVVGLILEQCQIIYVVMCRHKHKALKGFHPIVRSAGHPSSYLTVCVVWSCVYVAFCLCLVLPARLQPDSVVFYIFSVHLLFIFFPFIRVSSVIICQYWQKYFFTVKEERRTRGHGVTLAKKQCRLDIRKFSFSQRTVNEWNRLSADCVGASSVNIFKNKIDIYLRRSGYT